MQNITPWMPFKEYKYAEQSPKPKPWNIKIKKEIGWPNGKKPTKNKTKIKLKNPTKEEKNVTKTESWVLFLINRSIKPFNWINDSCWLIPIKITPKTKLNVKTKNKILNKFKFLKENEKKNFFCFAKTFLNF